MALLVQDGQVTPFPFVQEVADRMWAWGLDVRGVAFHPDGRTEVRFDEGRLVGYADLEPILSRFDPDSALSVLLAVDEFSDLPEVDVEETLPVRPNPVDPFFAPMRRTENCWKRHRETRYRTLPAHGSRWDRAS